MKSTACLLRWFTIGLLTMLAVPRAMAQGDGQILVYEFLELTGPNSEPARAYAINDNSQVVGWVEVSGTRHSAHWQNREYTDLAGTVHFELLHPIFDQDHHEAYDISNGGQIVGTGHTEVKCNPKNILATHGFVLRPAVLSDLATPYPGDALTNLRTFGRPCIAHDSAATGISDANHVVGWADLESGVIHAFLLIPVNGEFFVPLDNDDYVNVNSLMVDLGTLGAAADPVSSATAVNNDGQVTGYSYTVMPDGTAGYHAFLVTPMDVDGDGALEWFSGNNFVNDLMVDLGTLGGPNSWGRDINNNGVVVGESNVITAGGERYTHAFVWENGQMTDLGTLHTNPNEGFSAASAINDDGVIVGWAENDDRQRRAFVYRDGKMYDLNEILYLKTEDGGTITPRITLTEARGINSDGVIAGWGTVGTADDAVTRGFVLTPKWVDEAELEEDENEDTSEGSSGGGSEGGSSGDAGGQPTRDEIVIGTPGNLGSAVAGEDEEASPEVAPSTGFCGFGAASFLPITVMGLGFMRVVRRYGR